MNLRSDSTTKRHLAILIIAAAVFAPGWLNSAGGGIDPSADPGELAARILASTFGDATFERKEPALRKPGAAGLRSWWSIAALLTFVVAHLFAFWPFATISLKSPFKTPIRTATAPRAPPLLQA